ncbi:MAG: flagellar motor protein MotB [Saprospiraceae bacterium]|nr:MAG: flagellar motor protein MotB [Saprospiraceae bacterium]
MSMNLTLRLFAIFMIATLALSSCVSKKKFDQLMDEKGALASSLAESQGKVKLLEEKVAALETDMEAEKTRLNGEIAGIKKDLDAAKGQLASAKSDLQAKENEIATIKKTIKDAFAVGSDVKVSEVEGQMYVTLDEAVQYRTGSSSLNKPARKAVDQLATLMKNNPNMHILVEGYTDTDKYPAGSGMDNWQLSVNRAMAVVKRLIKKGVDPGQLTVAGGGEGNPVAPNDSADGKAKNRRTAAQPSPKAAPIYKIGN